MVQQLLKDFHNKCYICEMKELQDPQIEHLVPHKNGKYKDRKFDWGNLFLSCGHCNGVKYQSKYEEGILDCCKEDPEKMISFKVQENNICVTALDMKNRKAVLTAELVGEVFNICNTGMRTYKSEMRLQKLQTEMNVLYEQLAAYKENPSSRIVVRKLKVLLKRESAFAGFKRCFVREHCNEYPELAQFIA